ncbi:hypothetical protein BACCIP111883_01220 [Sutcliffiella rhizosphaerae]|uniref:Uncharacterized protein n=1 Tax=Sutcliffiella rhizosphaerae TaxID=2880967 RepID=A0ABM8YKI6_9BACI|nr:hypothetical protein BACCIP111883_01220 [Sutcliffiella rhizosphaerae]
MPEIVEGFEYLIRTQFSFELDDVTLSNILTDLSN